MKNILHYLKNDDDVQAAAMSRGKMTPRRKSSYVVSWLKNAAKKQRRAALKRGDVSSQSSQFGGEFSSWWD